MESVAIRITVLLLGSLLSGLLYRAGTRDGSFGGGIIMALGAIGIGLTSVIFVFAVSIVRLKKKREDIRIAYAFMLASLAALGFGASQMIAW